MQENDETIEVTNEESEYTFEAPKTFQELTDVDSEELITYLMSQDATKNFNNEMMSWQHYLDKKLRKYDDDVVYQMVQDVNTDGLLPDMKKGDIYSQYYRLVDTQKYLYSLHTPVNKRIEMLKDAIKSLRSTARNMFKGTEKDKDAHCDRMVQPFFIELSAAKVLLLDIVEKIEVVEFAATQASRVIKEHEFELRVNGGYVNQGVSDIFNKHNLTEDDEDPIPQKYRR